VPSDAPAVTSKPAEVNPAGTSTLAGSVIGAVPLATSETVTPDGPAG
jgi:hypothetical protein